MAEAEAKTEPPPQVGNLGETCCGGRHAPTNKDKSLQLACQLCETTSCYWQNEPGLRARAAANPTAYPYISS